jgi:hypothetical protein
MLEFSLEHHYTQRILRMIWLQKRIGNTKTRRLLPAASPDH